MKSSTNLIVMVLTFRCFPYKLKADMYYSHSCSYCTKVFYTFDNSKKNAARKLYEGIKKHLIAYKEDHKEYKFDEAPSIEANQMFKEMTESSTAPRGGYKV